MESLQQLDKLSAMESGKTIRTYSKQFNRYLIFNVYYKNNDDTIIKLLKQFNIHFKEINHSLYYIYIVNYI